MGWLMAVWHGRRQKKCSSGPIFLFPTSKLLKIDSDGFFFSFQYLWKMLQILIFFSLPILGTHVSFLSPFDSNFRIQIFVW